ncbi:MULTISPECIES: hypothetical protein [unclassified Rhizobium]|uniref:hypothetical protein n=1 Tax=unclassified Rhizobium TaxID=2613769 RepID=UPI001ADBDAC9|nr:MULTISPECIES: hypothetical protein [unclassified Rhizobium]MBO9125471.1 hypothetical protein [Rhizobium sp. 16-488-2b]MBO9176056.1 hypothetical protein [Rhizobium sp. 16-488-2a]
MDEEWISITEAAARLSAGGDRVDRSTLSRYLKQHAEALPLKPDGKSNLVDFVALAEHRGENVRIRSLPLPLPQSETRSAGSSASPSGRFSGTQSDGAARKAQADAELREMDLAERRKELTPFAEVDQAGRDAVAMMQSAFERAIETEASTLSLKYGWEERIVRLALKNFSKAGLAVFNRQVLEKLDAMRRRDDAGGDDAGQPEHTQSLQ